MPLKTSFWKRLFSGDTNETALCPAEATTIRNTLQNEYGLTVIQDNTPVEDLLARNYRKVSGDELSKINQIFQYVPQIVARNTTQSAVNTAFKAATEGTYRVQLSAGMHLANSKVTPGAYRGVGLSDINNKIVGNAELFKNDATLSVSNAPQIALSVFNVVSAVTGQYFMSQINSRLDALKTNVGHLEKMLDAQRHSTINESAQVLDDINRKSLFIIGNRDKTNEAVRQIHDIQNSSGKNLYEIQELILDKLNSFNEKDKKEIIKNNPRIAITS